MNLPNGLSVVVGLDWKSHELYEWWTTLLKKENPMSINIGIWLDHSRAIILQIEDKKCNVVTINSNVELKHVNRNIATNKRYSNG